MLGECLMTLPISVLLKFLEVGDEIRINDWDDFFTVCGISEDHILIYHGEEYSIIQRAPLDRAYNGIPAGSYICAPDYLVFGYYEGYHFTDPDWCERYLKALKKKTLFMSVRKRAQITSVQVRSNLFVDCRK